MSQKYKDIRGLNLTSISSEVLDYWKDHQVFDRSISTRDGAPSFVFYEGPPSANGMPGIHHVMGRTIKDIFCRFQTLNGKQVKRKAGWDTHGLPIELAVEKTLGIRKEDIGRSITVEEYNAACRREVMKYTDRWEDLTRRMGYWVDMADPYITYDNKYIESVWWLLGRLYDKGLLYKGYTIQPYSPAAGTGLSSHELNQPGCYREVKDTSAVAMFRLANPSAIGADGTQPVFFLAWTTTPWTLPSNTALAVGKDITYFLVKTFSRFTGKAEQVILAKDRFASYFKVADGTTIGVGASHGSIAPATGLRITDESYFSSHIAEVASKGGIIEQYEIVRELKGSELEGLRYEQLLTFSTPADGDAFKVVTGDFVTTEDGTGIVHIAPSFGADDFRVARQNGIGSLTLVDKRGRFLPEVQDGLFLYGEEFVKEAYYSDEEKEQELLRQKEKLSGFIKDTSKLNYLSVDERIVLKLQNEGRLFRKEKYEHNYPHCWRTDKPVIYYPLDSWFVKVTALRDRMVELNKTIHWKPESTGTGRFGNWLESANDWNLSRSRFWGIPLPIWRTEDGSEERCIHSAEELKQQIARSVAAGLMKENPLEKFQPNVHSAENYASFDLHKPYADDIVLVSPKGAPMYRESDLIDVWFDSGAMPYAQLHYPFENSTLVDNGTAFPADFIAEGVDQTRGWFYTLHAIATLCFDSIAYRNVVSNGLVLDKNGNKMSKRLGNAIDPFETLSKFGPDATRWYMITNAQPWDNLRFDLEGIAEVQRKFFGTLSNTYAFFTIYANIDGFVYDRASATPLNERSELDRWIISRLNSLVQEVCNLLNDYDPTPAARAIEDFVDAHLSNWFVRLSRKRFWHGEMTPDKKAAYDTLFECLVQVAQLSSPFAPFYSDWIYQSLLEPARAAGKRWHPEGDPDSVHLSYLPNVDHRAIDIDLEERMFLAQEIASMVLSIRKKENIRVRQPLSSIRVPVLDDTMRTRIQGVADLVLAEVNVRKLELVDESEARIVKNLRLNFKTLGRKCGKHMKELQAFASGNQEEIIRSIETTGVYTYPTTEGAIDLVPEDVEIIPVDIPGWKVVNDGRLTVALDVTITEDLHREGIAREFVNRIQNLRKDEGLEVTDKISVKIASNPAFNEAVLANSEYIRAQVLAGDIQLVDDLTEGRSVEIDDGMETRIFIQKLK